MRVRSLDDRSALDRLERTLMLVSHENVERIRDAGERDGLLYTVSDEVAGTLLCDLLAKRTAPLSRGEFLPMLHQICAGLAAIHSAGAVHGNVGTRFMSVSGGIVTLLGAGLTDGGTTTKDIRSAGLAFLEMLTGTAAGDNPSLPELPADLSSFVGSCLDVDGGFRNGQQMLEAASRLQVAAPSRTLADLMGEEPAESREVVPLFLRIVDQMIALQAKAARLDFSPRKVRLRSGGAIEIDTASRGSVQHTMAAEPKYCPPEMFRAPADDFDQCASAYIYVLGFVLYEILAGQRLFQQQFLDLGAEPDAFQWMRWQADQQKTLRPLAELRPGFPADLSTLIGKMTEKDGLSRISRLEEVRDGLAALPFIAVQPTQPAQTPPAAPLPRRKRRAAAITATLVIAGCLLATGAWFAARSLPFGAAETATALPREIETATGAMVLVIGSSTAPFYIDRYEITNWQYKRFCDETGRACGSSPGWDPRYFAQHEYPVRNLPEADFEAYATWAGKRVPNATEISASSPQFAVHRYPWEPAPEPASMVGFRCAADPRQALKLRNAPLFSRIWRDLAKRLPRFH